MRQAITYQIQQFRTKNPQKICQCVSCQQLSDQYHVDHQIGFKTLQEKFLKMFPAQAIKDFDDCKITQQKVFQQKDKQWKEKWQKFHQQNAKLRWLCSPCNLKRKKNFNINDY